MFITQDVTSAFLILCQLYVYVSVTIAKDVNEGKNGVEAPGREGAAIPTPLTPNQLAKQLKFTNMPTHALPMTSIIPQGHIINPKQPIALPNYLSLLQRQKHQLPSLQTQPGGSTFQNSALQLLQLQKSLTPAANIPLLATLPKGQCVCSQPVQAQLDGNLKSPSSLQPNNPLQPQPRLNMQGPLQITPPLETQSPLQLLSPLDILNALQSQSPLQLQSLLRLLSPSQLQSLLQSWSPLQLLSLLQTQFPMQLQPSLQNFIKLLLIQKLNLLKANLNLPAQLNSPLHLKVDRQLPEHPPSTTVLQNNNNPPHTTPCQQLRLLLSKILQLIIPPQSSTTIQNGLHLINQNTNKNVGVNHLYVGKSPVQVVQEQLQLSGGNNNLPLNLLSNLQSQSGHSLPTQILYPIYQQNFQNLNKLGSISPMKHNIINPFLAANMAMNRRLMKRSAKSEKKPGQIDLTRNFVQPLNVARVPKSINAINIPGPFGNLPGMQIPSRLYPLSVNTREINKTPGPLASLIQGLPIRPQARTSHSDSKSIGDNNQGLPIPNEAKPLSLNSSVKTEKNNLEIQDGKTVKILVDDIKEMAREYKHINPKEDNSSNVKTENDNLESHDGKAGEILVEDVKEMAKVYKHIIPKENTTDADEKSHNTSKENETITALPEKDNQRKQDLNSKTDESISTIDTKTEVGKSGPLKDSQILKESRSDLSSNLPDKDNLEKNNSKSIINKYQNSTNRFSEESLVDSYSLDNPKGGLKLASQLLKEARLDLSALDNIISGYSIKENELLDLPSKVNEDNPLISQEIVETDTSNSIDGSGSLNNLKVALSSTDGSTEKSSKKQESKINPTQLERLLKFRLEAGKNSESLAFDAPSNETNTDTTLYIVSNLVNEAKTDLSKIQDDLVQSLSLHSLGNKEKRESNPFQTNIIKASTLLNQADFDLSSMQESLLAAKVINDIKAKHTDSEVKDKDDQGIVPAVDDNKLILSNSDASLDNEDSDIFPSVDDDLIGNEENDKSYRVKRVLSDQ